MDLLQRVRATIDAHRLLPRQETVVVGVSGGADSLCLLHVLARLSGVYGVRLHVGHLDHGLRGEESAEDALYVQELCVSWGLPVTVGGANVPALMRERRLALEEAARQARYRFLGDLARSLGAHTVAVAHHADDQAETVLMHLLRGAGLAGLRGMRPLSWLDELRLGDEGARQPERIRLIRPLLEVDKAAIDAYVRALGLQPRFDRSNLDTTHYRNRLRHELLPILETYNPNVRQVLRRTAEALAGDYETLREVLEETWARVVRQETPQAITFDLAGLRALSPGLARSVLREGVHRLRRSLRNVNWVHIEDARRVVALGRTGAAATLPAGLMLRLGYDDATLASEHYRAPDDAPRLAPGASLTVPVPGRVALGAGDWALTTRLAAREELPEGWDARPHPLTAYLDSQRVCGATEPRALVLRTRQPGDRLAPLGMGGATQTLGDFLINAKVPRGERDGLPLLVTAAGEVAWVVGWRVDERYAVREDTREVLVARMARARRGGSAEDKS